MSLESVVDPVPPVHLDGVDGIFVLAEGPTHEQHLYEGSVKKFGNHGLLFEDGFLKYVEAMHGHQGEYKPLSGGFMQIDERRRIIHVYGKSSSLKRFDESTVAKLLGVYLKENRPEYTLEIHPLDQPYQREIIH